MPNDPDHSSTDVTAETAPEPLVCELCRSIHGSASDKTEDHCAGWCRHDSTSYADSSISSNRKKLRP